MEIRANFLFVTEAKREEGSRKTVKNCGDVIYEWALVCTAMPDRNVIPILEHSNEILYVLSKGASKIHEVQI